MKVNEAARERMKMTSATMKSGRDRPAAVTRRPPLNESPSGTENENDVTNELKSDENVPKRGADITVPGISENENSEENLSPRGGKYILRPNPNPNFSDEYRY